MTDNRLSDEDLQHVLVHTRDLWEGLRGKRIFITGGTGFLGCWLLESFAWANDRLDLEALAVVLTRDPNRFRHKAPHLAEHRAIRLNRGDVRSFEFPPGGFSHVVHAASEFGQRATDQLTALGIAVDGSRRVMDFAKWCGAARVLLTSSGAVYGTQPSGLSHLREDWSGAPDPLNSTTAYAQGKRIAEHLCGLYHGGSGIEATIARCFTFVGPHLPLDGHFAVGNFIRDAIAGRTVKVNGDGTPLRSYLYAADMSVWLWTVLFRGEPNRAYNVGSEHVVNTGALAAHVAARCGVSVDIANTPVLGQEAHRYVPSTQRARAELGLIERIGLDDAIDRTIRWLQTTN